MTYQGTLTAEDLAAITALRDQWTQAALSTERCDRPAAEEAVTAAYQAAGIDKPTFIWMDSPVGGMLASAAISLSHEHNRDQLWGQFRDQVGGQLGDQLRDQLRDQLGGQLEGQLRGQFRDQLWGQLGGQLWGQLWDQLWDRLGDQLGDQLDPWYEAYWLAFYVSGLRVADMPPSPRLDTLATAVQALGWWWPRRGVAILTDRPTAIRRDPLGRLHADQRPALEWADGYALHSWHGQTVPADFWKWDVTRALQETNTELRRCGIERIGWDAVTDRMQLVATCDDPGNPGQRLALYDPSRLGDLYDQPARILLVSNASLDKGGHRRRFGLPVEAHHDDPVAAAASLFDIPTETYRSLNRAC